MRSTASQQEDSTMFGKRITIFRLLGFEVRIDASWFIIAFLIVWTLAKGYFPFQSPDLAGSTYWWMAIAGALGLFGSIVIHEFAHSIVARRSGLSMKGITLFIFGGVAEMETEPPNAATELRMAIAGPITSVLLGGFFYATYLLGTGQRWPAALLGIFSYLAVINIALAVFNMLPAFPLDGGRVLRAYLWDRGGDLRAATRTVSTLGSAFGSALIVLGLLSVFLGNLVGGIWWSLIGMFLRSASQMSYQQLEIRRALQGEPISRFMKRDPVSVPPSITLQELVDNYIYQYYFDMFPVVEDSRLIGCIGTKDLKQVPRHEWSRRTVGELAHPSADTNTIPPETDAVEALAAMTRARNSRLIVAQNGHLRGVVTLKDLLDFLALKLDLEAGKSDVRDVSEARNRS